MKRLLRNEIKKCLVALKEPNVKIDNYRCYFEGRKALAEELLSSMKVADKSPTKKLPSKRSVARMTQQR